MYSITLYNNTGFDPVNVPDGPATLQAAASSVVEFPAIDTVQNYFLSSISIKATFEQVKFADYCKVGDFYYFVNSLTMSSPDVAVLSLTPDGLTSGLAKGAITAISGTTERRRVLTSEDKMGAFNGDDPLMAPQEPLQIVMGDDLFIGGGATVSVPYVESLIDLVKLQNSFTDGKFTGRTFTDPQDEESKVTVPSVDSLTGQTTFAIGARILPSTKTQLYRYSKVQEAIGLARALGVESGIINQFSLPPSLVETTETEDGSVTLAKGIDQKASTGLPFKYSTVKNQKLLYGQYNKYGLLTVSGNRFEAAPEEISSTFTGSPEVKCKSDPRPNGKPYFRYSSYLGDSSDTGFWKNSISGLQWAQVPLVYTEKSNNFQDTYNFQASRIGAAIEYNQAQRHFIQGALPGLAGLAGGFAKTLGGALSGNIGMLDSGIGSIASNVYNLKTQQYDMRDYESKFRLAQEKELLDFGYSQSVVVPTLNFPYNGDAIRDVLGNGVINYRYRYSDNDLKRIDKLLTMYGYIDRRKFEPSMMNAHKDFDYLQLTGVSISGNTIPMWWRDIIKTQLNTGLRIWHVKPDPKYYE